MIVHFYSQVWNDEWMLPFFFRHYDEIVDHYFIYDDGSSDATLSLLLAHPNVTLRSTEHSVANSIMLSAKVLFDECWKQSRGHADWVICACIDEHLFHPNGRHYLSDCAAEGATLIPALGFQMISNSRPQPAETLCRDYTFGVPWHQMMKLCIFNPNAITEINYSVGLHQADPIGQIQVPKIDELMLFHYKYMGFEETHLRHQEAAKRLEAEDIHRGWGHKYSWSEAKLKEDWNNILDKSFDITTIRTAPASYYPIKPWWLKYRENAPGITSDQVSGMPNL